MDPSHFWQRYQQYALEKNDAKKTCARKHTLKKQMALGKVDNAKKISEGIKNKRTELLRLLENSQNTSNPGIDSKILGGKKTSIAEEIIPGIDKWDYVKI